MVKGAKKVQHRLIFNKADNTRIAGWQLMRDFIASNPSLWNEDIGV